MDDPISWSYPSNQTKWIFCSDGDYIDPHKNYCGVTENSTIPYTVRLSGLVKGANAESLTRRYPPQAEDLALTEGLKRMDLANQSGKPWWISIGECS